MEVEVEVEGKEVVSGDGGGVALVVGVRKLRKLTSSAEIWKR